MELDPGSECQQYYSARYWQGLVMSKIKEFHTDAEAAALSTHVRKNFKPAASSAATPAADDDSSSSAACSAGDDDGSADNIISSMANTSISGPPRTPARRGHQEQPQMDTPLVPRTFQAAGGMRNPATSDETYVNMALLVLLQALTLSMAQRGKSFDARLDFGGLDWLADRLPLKLHRRHSESQVVELMEARVDGYLCKRRFEDGMPQFNNVPLAVVEAKACTRRAAGSAIRWQESAEMACWVSSLDEKHENYGLLQSSTSGRKRYVWDALLSSITFHNYMYCRRPLRRTN